MDSQHFNPGQEGTPASLIPEETGESPSGSQISGSAERLRLHHREHQLHHSMSTDWKALQRVCENCPTHYCYSTSRHWSCTAQQRVRRARSIIRDTSHPRHRLWEALQESRNRRLRNSFLPSAVNLLNYATRWLHAVHTVSIMMCLSVYPSLFTYITTIHMHITLVRCILLSQYF